MGGNWYGGPMRPCPGQGCNRQIPVSHPMCQECQRQQAAEELAISMLLKREIGRLEGLLRFEAWCDERDKEA